jgi:hypothetical protein
LFFLLWLPSLHNGRIPVPSARDRTTAEMGPDATNGEDGLEEKNIIWIPDLKGQNREELSF